MVRVLVTAIISILLYNAISFVYVLFNDKESLDEYYMSKDMRIINSTIEGQLSLRRSVSLSEISSRCARGMLDRNRRISIIYA